MGEENLVLPKDGSVTTPWTRMEKLTSLRSIISGWLQIPAD